MPTIVDMRPSTNTFRHATLIVIWLVVCLVGLGGCKSNLVKETCIDKPVWTTVVAKDCYTETVNQQTHTVYELTLIADGRDNQFKLRVDKPTYDRAFINNKPNRLSFNLNRSDYGTGWEPLIVALYFIMLVGGLACVIIEGIKYMIDIKEHLSWYGEIECRCVTFSLSNSIYGVL